MDKGRIIYLNGVTSSGKTSIVEVFCPPDLCRQRNITFYFQPGKGVWL